MRNDMISATEDFEIRYSWDCEELVGEISGTLIENMERIKGFFRLEKLDKKIVVIIYPETGAYISHVEQCGQAYYEWMIADTFDGRIHVLSLEACRRSISHARMDREELMFHYQELPAAYAISYQLGKYMLEHLPNEQIYNYIRKPAALWEDTENILEQAKANILLWEKNSYGTTDDASTDCE